MAKKENQTKVKRYIITIPKEEDNKKLEKEQFKVFQLDGRTVRVPIGVSVEVPEWVAKRAKEIGMIDDYAELD